MADVPVNFEEALRVPTLEDAAKAVLAMWDNAMGDDDYLNQEDAYYRLYKGKRPLYETLRLALSASEGKEPAGRLEVGGGNDQSALPPQGAGAAVAPTPFQQTAPKGDPTPISPPAYEALRQQPASEGKEPAILQPTPVSGEALIAAGFVPLEQNIPSPSDPGAVSGVDALVEEARKWLDDHNLRDVRWSLISRLATALECSRLTEADVEGIAQAIYKGRPGGTSFPWKWRQEHQPNLVEQLLSEARTVIAHLNASWENGE